MGEVGWDALQGLVFLALWAVSAPALYRIGHGGGLWARNPLMIESLLMGHLILLVLGVIGVIDTVWDLL